MRGSVASFVDIQEWAGTTLKNSQEFNDFCVATIGEELGFFSSFPFNQVVENPPCMIFYSEIYNGNNVDRGDFFRSWTLPFVIQIIPDEESEDINGVISWTSTNKIKKIAYKVCEILEKTAECGINELDIRLTEIESLTITDIDEADDLQAQLFVRFEETSTL